MLLYGSLSGLWYWVLAPLPLRPSYRILTAFVIAVGFGAINEWRQIHLPGRYGTLADVLLNAMGAGLGLLVAVLMLG